MILQNLKLINFRSYEQLNISIPKGLVFFCGENAVGKSSILESIQYNLTTKSFRSLNPNDFITHGHKHFNISCNFSDDTSIIIKKTQDSPSIHIDKNDKKITKRTLAYTKPICLIESENFFFTTSNPEKRRQYLNKILFYVEQNFSKTMTNFKKIHQNRNIALKKGQNHEISVWGDQLLLIEEEITRINEQIIARINKELTNKDLFSDFYDKNPWIGSISIDYFKGYDHTKTYSQVLTENLDKDLILKRTSDGPHKRLFKISVNNSDINLELSRGQQKLLSILFHLIQREIIQQSTNIAPLLLIDDISSELDKENLETMLKYLDKNTMQSLITIIDKNIIDNTTQMFYVEQNGDTSYVR